MKELPSYIRRFLARAQMGVESLPLHEREEHYQAIVDLLPEDTHEAELASHTLAMIRAAERAQSEFTQLLTH